MSIQHDIPWFNPRQMDDATVLALNTGGETLLGEFYRLVCQRIATPSAGRHWLVTGPRGAGKSFFLRLVQATFARETQQCATFVLLPEELPNVYAPHEWLGEVERMLPGKAKTSGSATVWKAKEEAASWDAAYQALLGCFSGALLVIGVENFDRLLEQAFETDVRASRLRTLLETEPRIMLLATAVESEFDEDYQRRMFRQFEHQAIRHWDRTDHRLYLERRAALLHKVPTPGQLARIDAYSRYTGGSARIAAVLAATILDEQDPLLASSDLKATLDRMSDYYRALMERIPLNSRKVFDALMRGREPASQVEVAERIGARQSDIAKAFGWLVDYGYVRNDAPQGSKAYSYRVTDRLFVQFYRMRYLEPDQPCQLAILADFLAVAIEFRDKWRFAAGYLNEGRANEARLMTGLALRERDVDESLLPEHFRQVPALVKLGEKWMWREMWGEFLPFCRSCYDRFQTEESFREAYEEAKAIAAAVKRYGLRGDELVEQVEQSLSLNPMEMYRCFAAAANPRFSPEQWRKLTQIFKEEAEEFSKLEENEDSTIQVLRVRLSGIAKTHPLAESLTNFVKLRIGGVRKYLADLPIVEATAWGVRAVQLWLSAGLHDEVSNALQIVGQGISQLLDSFDQTEQALVVLLPLQSAVSKLRPEEAMIVHWMLGRCFGVRERDSEALAEHQAGRQLAQSQGKSKEAALFAGQMGWHLGALGKLDEAIETHLTAAREYATLEQLSYVAWNLGQAARRQLGLGYSDDAWQGIDSFPFESSSHDIAMIQQLGDGIWDHSRIHDPAGTFAFARQILVELARRPRFQPAAVVRALWIDMIDTGVPLPLLLDLLYEIPGVFSATDLDPLVAAIESWIRYLMLSPEDRFPYLRGLDPDVAETLTALGKELSPRARHRFDLNSGDHSAL